ncbi:Lrp/AsnC family transcriptional regulator [Candidatus Pacearchaeota archaeon]|nr:Lrp/AsnC family transcriptional regulator [Candidatus Pacearchaeota archaeon]
MPVKSALKSRIIDEKDKKILHVLQENGREQLNKIAKKVGLSIDSTHKRIKVMIEKGIFHPTILVDPRVIGFPLIADIKIKLKNVSQKALDDFISHLKKHPRCIELLSIMGDYDFTLVLIAKDGDELEKLSTEIRQKYKDLIDEWKSNLVLKTHKFEEYLLE